MDQTREIRFLIPPFFLFASLLWGAHFDSSVNLTQFLKLNSAPNILGILAAVTVSLVPLGFLIGTFSVTALRIAFWLFTRSDYEVSISDEGLRRIWPQLRSKQKLDKRVTLYAVATFDHEIIPAKMHDWIVRRWNSFNVCIHSCSALLLAHMVGYIVSIHQDFRWWLITVILIVVLAANARIAWRQTMDMIDFQSYRTIRDKPT